MGQNTLSSREMQAERLKIKQIGQQMANLAVQGAGLSPWEARELVQIIEEVYFQDPALKQLQPGQMKYSCVRISEPAGKPIKDCQMVTVTLTLLHDEDTTGLPCKGKRPVRYMSGGRTNADRKLKNYFEMGFQNGGSRESI